MAGHVTGAHAPATSAPPPPAPKARRGGAGAGRGTGRGTGARSRRAAPRRLLAHAPAFPLGAPGEAEAAPRQRRAERPERGTTPRPKCRAQRRAASDPCVLPDATHAPKKNPDDGARISLSPLPAAIPCLCLPFPGQPGPSLPPEAFAHTRSHGHPDQVYPRLARGATLPTEALPGALYSCSRSHRGSTLSSSLAATPAQARPGS